MTPIVTLYNHKGGVSKTTTTFNLGWALADRGKKVLVIDADPQCNLTGIVLGFNGVNEEVLLDEYPANNIYSGLSPAFSARPQELDPITPTQSNHENLFLLPGNVSLAENEAQLAVALSTSQTLTALQNLPGSFRRLIELTCNVHGFDIVLIDVSPSVGALNQSILMSSDFFIIPTSPDFFCFQAVESLNRILPRWVTETNRFREGNSGIDYRLPDSLPQFLGFISQRYRPRENRPVASFQLWIDRIASRITETLFPTLQGLGMALDVQRYLDCGVSGYAIANIPDFNSLIAISHENQKPPFALTNQEIGRSGHVQATMTNSRDEFVRTFREFADRIICLTEI